MLSCEVKLASVMHNGVSLDEYQQRFDLLRGHLVENDGDWYFMRAQENRLLYGGEVKHKPTAASSALQRRYFNCFYDSFRQRNGEFYRNLLNEVMQKEWAERGRLNEYEEEEFYGICRSAGNVLGVAEWGGLYYTSLPPLESEEFGRRMIISKFFAMLLEAVSLLEVLHRRTIVFAEEPPARKLIEGEEVHEWVESRRLQVERERQEEMALEAGERQRYLAYCGWKQQQAYQVFLFGQSEQEERMDVERLQRFHAGVIAHHFYKEHKEARYHQLRYQMRQRLLPAALARGIVGDEVKERSVILLLQRDRYSALQAEEVKSYLWTKRNALLNELVDRERGGKGCVYTYM
ncbi:hypothetical protein TraAM80_03348 [Trypanosoma rangeli]|uniref:Uncharacterized protein n=1 Tax=Trypanosoma rangeli TaxID=5698 RepID=A0A422NPU4_TRYRA|nr:uncharacterized protein TraAM80_03348 [Trypanosoma rangeli]RNF07492.1 hypothetical protein TraAM80_03348 [Trypanosoma rangeli]|eukprot:RNF07492.1 hypothetical protein TraAM80_03348 [Trypanosoma rangeli]